MQLDIKNLPFEDVLYHFVFFYFSTARQVAFTLRKMMILVKDYKTAQPMRD